MNSTTLRGVFPEPKTVHKKNFIKENMRQIKQMQGLLQNSDESRTKSDKFRNVPPKVTGQFNAPVTKARHKISLPSLDSSASSKAKLQLQKTVQTKQKSRIIKHKLEIKQLRDFGEIARKEELSGIIETEKITHRGIQTERSDDLNKIYESGVIKYPSPSVVNQIDTGKTKLTKKYQDHGDTASTKHGDIIAEKIQHLKLDDKPDFIKQNMLALKQKTTRQEALNTSTVPPNYQKGALPKYLKDRKEEQQKDQPEDTECPTGHVLLPEEERKETLRVLRQSYADRIQELNAMPVRNDTLRMRKRKMELEEELKKIDEGIKVFQRPKVFVKINA